MEKTALITGANKGIGFEVARRLGQEGYRVFLSARSAERGQHAHRQLAEAGLRVSFVQMDVGDGESIAAAFREVKRQTDRLDVLINNAAVLLDRGDDLLSMAAQQIEDTIRINALGALFVTRTFVPLLVSGSRVVNVSSGAGAICQGMGSWAPVYSISKTAMNAITVQLAHALRSRGVTVNAVCPGWVRTDMGGSGANRPVEKGAETPVWLAAEPGLAHTGKFFRDKREIAW